MDFLMWSRSLIGLVFVIGYFCIAYEHRVKLHKAASALGMAGVCWLILFLNPSLIADTSISSALGKACEVCLFLLGALAIVEMMDAHHSFAIITHLITARSPIKLLWIIGTLTFFFSAILDNLTTTVVMVTLLQQLLPKGESRLLLGGAIVIAANAGGAWTPIGDVTTTMLWIGGQISATSVMKALFEPSVLCCITSFLALSYQLQSHQTIEHTPEVPYSHHASPKPYSRFFLVLGISILLLIPILKTFLGLAPVMGMLLGLGIIWIVGDIIHSKDADSSLSLATLLRRIDLPSILFFLGILLTVETLEIAGLLGSLAAEMERLIPDRDLIAFTMGLISAIIDNVPLVAAVMKMYTLETDPTGSIFWHSIAYAAGTGGSILIIGSAAGVAFMGMEHATFGWWMRRVTPAAFLGYIAGFGLHLLLSQWTN